MSGHVLAIHGHLDADTGVVSTINPRSVMAWAAVDDVVRVGADDPIIPASCEPSRPPAAPYCSETLYGGLSDPTEPRPDRTCGCEGSISRRRFPGYRWSPQQVPRGLDDRLAHPSLWRLIRGWSRAGLVSVAKQRRTARFRPSWGGRGTLPCSRPRTRKSLWGGHATINPHQGARPRRLRPTRGGSGALAVEVSVTGAHRPPPRVHRPSRCHRRHVAAMPAGLGARSLRRARPAAPRGAGAADPARTAGTARVDPGPGVAPGPRPPAQRPLRPRGPGPAPAGPPRPARRPPPSGRCTCGSRAGPTARERLWRATPSRGPRCDRPALGTRSRPGHTAK